MRRITALAAIVLSLTLAACSSIETRPTDTAEFEALGYTYFKWRSQPLSNSSRSADSLYLMDPIIRREVNAQLTAKGYVLDNERAQFSVDYLQATGLRMGVDSQDASGGIDPIPSARPNRQINQAMVDNANALSGVQETNNIALQFNSVETHQEIWRVLITKIVENTNRTDTQAMEKGLSRGIQQGLRTLPTAP
jgi:hypothetical protein